MRKRTLWTARLGVLAGLMPLLAHAELAPLPPLGADLSKSSVSGISSGGFMAAQLATAYSATFMGVGVIAAGPYYCAGTYPDLSFMQNATATCMSPAGKNVTADAAVSLKNATRFAGEGRIDAVANLARQRVYVFSGASDHTVKTIVSDQVPVYYKLAGAAAPQIVYRKEINAGHSIITNHDDDVACSTTAPPYINNCGFVQSHELLRHIYGDASAAPAKRPGGEFIRFNQGEFVQGSRASMDNAAYVYVPKSCQKEAGCAVHVALHGCEQGAAKLGDRFYKGTGYHEFADTNRMIVLYPQAVASSGMPPNPKGCWDFWGYSSENQKAPNFFAKDAPQMKAIFDMLQRLARKAADAP